MGQSQDRFTDCRENLIVVVVANVERQVTINSFQRAGPNQATRATRANALFDRVFREVLHHVTRATARNLRFEISARLPQVSHMSQPQVRSLHVHRHLTNVMLHVRILDLFLRRDVVERVIVRGFSGAEKVAA